MAYPPSNPYDPAQGYGQQPTPQHYTTDADPYSRPDPYGPGTGYGNPPLNVQPGSVPPQPYSPAAYPAQPGGFPPPAGPPAGPPGGAFQPGQAAPPPPRGNSNAPLIVTFAVIVLAITVGGIFLVTNLGDDDEDPLADSTTGEATTEEATTEAAEETTEAAPTTEEATTGSESTYRVPREGECIENVTTGFYVVDCESADAYWHVVHIEPYPEDPDPSDEWHTEAARNACDGTDWTQYYYTDTALAASRDWDPDSDSITAIYCVREV